MAQRHQQAAALVEESRDRLFLLRHQVRQIAQDQDARLTVRLRVHIFAKGRSQLVEGFDPGADNALALSGRRESRAQKVSTARLSARNGTVVD